MSRATLIRGRETIVGLTMAVIFGALALGAAAGRPGDAKVARVRGAREQEVRELFRRAGVSYPARGVLLRGFKGDRELELWARDGRSPVYRPIKTYPICAVSGVLGPKRKEWDLQTPEGVYRVNHFNPQSGYHLSLGIDYPNRSDRILGDPHHPGDAIYIHGGCATIGCLPLGDAAIEEVYLICLDADRAGGRTAVHLFPCRLGSKSCRVEMDGRVAASPGLRGFWNDLDRVQAAFDRGHRLPRVAVDRNGRYTMREN